MRFLSIPLASLAGFGCLRAGAGDVANAYRFTAFPWYDLDDHFTVFAHLGTTFNPDNANRVSNLISPGIYYKAFPALELWAGFNNRFTRNDSSADQLELRPFVGAKYIIPNDWHVHLYDFTRYEYRAIEDLDTHDWHRSQRIRSRIGAEIPLASWKKPGTRRPGMR